MDKVKNFCDHSIILREMAANRKPTGHFWTTPASFRVNEMVDKRDFLKIINLFRGCKRFVTWCGALGSTKIVQKYQRGQKLFRNCQKLCWEKIPTISRITSLQVIFQNLTQRYTDRVLQTIQMKLILLWVWAERAVLGRAKTALKFKYEI